MRLKKKIYIYILYIHIYINIYQVYIYIFEPYLWVLSQKYCIVQDGVRDISWRTRRFAMHTDSSVVLCTYAGPSAQVSSSCVRAFSSSLANLHLDFFSLFFMIKVYFNVDSSSRCYWASREIYIYTKYI